MTNQSDSGSRLEQEMIDLLPSALRRALVRVYISLNRPLFAQIENLRSELGALRGQCDGQLQDTARRVEALELRPSTPGAPSGTAIREMIAAIEGRLDALAARGGRLAHPRLWPPTNGSTKAVN